MLQLIHNLQSGDNQKIKQAELNLQSYQQNNTSQFCTECITILSDENTHSEIRQLAGTLLRRTILQSINDKLGWDYLAPDTKENVKNALTDLLQTKDRKVKRATADNVSAICAVEVPRGEWVHIVPNLITNVGHQNVDIREAALMSLGFIAQLMKQKGSFLDKNLADSMFASIVGGIKDENPSINQLAMNAFINCLNICQSLFQSENVRNVVFKELTNVVENSPNIQSKKLGLQSLAEVVKQAYFAMEPCIEPLLIFTLGLIQNHKYPELCRRSMEIWRVLIEQHLEIPKSTNYIKTEQAKKLSEALMINMTIIAEGEENEDQENIRGSAYRALCALGETNGEDIKQLVLNFISSTISDSDWKKRQASIKAFTCLLDGLESKVISDLTLNALTQFLKLLKDTSDNVKVSAAFSLAKIAQKVPQAFIQHPNLSNILNNLIGYLGGKPQIAKEICSLFNNLFESDLSAGSPVIVNASEAIMDALFNTGVRTDIEDGSLAGIAFLAALILIVKVKNIAVASKYIRVIIENFHNTYSISQNNIRFSVHSGILSVLQGAFSVVSTQQVIPPEIISSTFELVTDYFQKINDVDANGLYILAELCPLASKQGQYFESVWQYVVHALKRHEDSELFKAVLLLLGDLSRHNPEKFKNYISIVVDIASLLQNPSFNNECKITIITFISDIFLTCSDVMRQHEERVLYLIEQSFSGCLYLLNINFDYSDRLREILIDSASYILHSISTKDNPNQNYLKIVPSIIYFIKANNTEGARPSIRFMRDSIFLCLDLIQIYDKKIEEYFKDPFLGQTLEVLGKHNANGEQQDVIEFAKMVLPRL